jgi:hypothetical protein
LAALQRIATTAIDAQADALDLRRDAAHVEGLNADPPGELRLAHRSCHGGRKRLRVRRVGPRRRRQFGFNIEADMVGLGLPCQIEDLHQCRDADAIHSPLLRKGRGVGRSGLQAPDVIALELRQCERTDRGPLGVEKLVVRSARVVGVETVVVADDESPVAGMARSSSSVVTPIDNAMLKAASVFSGAKPRAPRWPCRSNAPAAELRTKLTAMIAAAVIFAIDALQARAASSSGRRLRRLRDAIMTPLPPHEWRWRLARSKPAR